MRTFCAKQALALGCIRVFSAKRVESTLSDAGQLAEDRRACLRALEVLLRLGAAHADRAHDGAVALEEHRTMPGHELGARQAADRIEEGRPLGRDWQKRPPVALEHRGAHGL